MNHSLQCSDSAGCMAGVMFGPLKAFATHFWRFCPWTSGAWKPTWSADPAGFTWKMVDEAEERSIWDSGASRMVFSPSEWLQLSKKVSPGHIRVLWGGMTLDQRGRCQFVIVLSVGQWLEFPLVLWHTLLPTFWRGSTNMYKVWHCINSEAYTSGLSGTPGCPA